MSRPSPYHSLFLDELGLSVHLGCTAEERALRQEVRLSAEFRFETPPPGFVSDRLEDTVCYAEVAGSLREHIEAREYNLIEKIAADAYEIAKSITGQNVAVAVNVHKVRPPVEALRGGTRYRAADFPP